MKLELTIGLDDCADCAKAMFAFNTEAIRIDENSYGTRNLVTGKRSPSFSLRADRNAEGHVTHWHLDELREV